MEFFYSVILYKCKNRLNKKFPENVIDNRQKVFITKDVNELHGFLKKSKFSIVVYDGEQRDTVIKEFKKSKKSTDAFLVIIMTNKEARKFNFKKHQRTSNIIYISNPPSVEELSQFFKFLFQIQELKVKEAEAENIIGAYEMVSEFSRKELQDAYNSLKAYEIAEEISRKELIESKKSLEAWEKVVELARNEKMELEKEKTAYDNIIEFNRKENIFLDRLLKAWETVMEMGRKELIKAYEEIEKLIERSKTNGGNDK